MKMRGGEGRGRDGKGGKTDSNFALSLASSVAPYFQDPVNFWKHPYWGRQGMPGRPEDMVWLALQWNILMAKSRKSNYVKKLHFF